MMKLTMEDILTIHEILADETGGSRGLRNEGLLDSALQAPFQTFAGEELYDGVIAKAAKLGHGLINNHPFVDGNKRMGILAMLTFLELNGHPFKMTDQELVTLTIQLADGKVTVEELEQILING